MSPCEKGPIFIHVGSTSIEVRTGTDMNLLSDIVHGLGGAITLMNMPFEKVYLACGSTDMRKMINELLSLQQWEVKEFWLYYRRLEKGTFQWPSNKDATPMHISPRQYRWLLDGMYINQQQLHREVTSRTIRFYNLC